MAYSLKRMNKIKKVKFKKTCRDYYSTVQSHSNLIWFCCCFTILRWIFDYSPIKVGARTDKSGSTPSFTTILNKCKNPC